MPDRPRLLIAVQPALLGCMLANIFTQLGADEVMDLGVERPTGTHYDAALTTAILPANFAADVIIGLPDPNGNSGIGEITDRNVTKTVVIKGLDTVLELLDDYCPAQIRRSPHA